MTALTIYLPKIRIKPILISTFPALILYGLSILFSSCPAYGDQALLKKGVKNYKNSKYRKAAYYFYEAKRSDPDSAEAGMAAYALKTIRDSRSLMQHMEEDEAVFRADINNDELAMDLSERHYGFAKKLISNPITYPIFPELHLKKAIELNPDNTNARMALGDIYYKIGDYQSALQEYENILSYDPGDLRAYEMAGRSAVGSGYFTKADILYRQLLAKIGNDGERYDAKKIGKIKRIIDALPVTYPEVERFLRDGNIEKAESILKDRVDLNPSDHIAKTALARVYLEKGNKKLAEGFLKEALISSPAYTVAHFYLARIYYASRDYENSINEYAVFKDEIGALPIIRGDLKKIYMHSMYRLSEIYFMLREHDECRNQIEEILKADPQEQDAHYNLGVYYYVCEHDRSKAYKSFAKTVEINPANETGKAAKYAIEFMRNNPDSRFTPDLSFIYDF